MAKDIIGLITSVEDDDYQGKAFKKVTLGTGEVLKVKYGREGALKDKWPLLGVGVAIHFKMKDFIKQGEAFPFVEDIEVTDISTVASELPELVKVGGAVIPTTIAPVEPPEVKWAGISPAEEKRRSMAISYAKDLACHGKIGVEDMKRYANDFLKYMKGEIS